MAINKQGFTYEEWAALTDAEAPLYEDQTGLYAHTDVCDRNDGGLVCALWKTAQFYVENGGEDLDANEQIEEIAQRVAHALHTLVVGVEA